MNAATRGTRFCARKGGLAALVLSAGDARPLLSALLPWDMTYLREDFIVQPTELKIIALPFF
jgi:hypothetical protein